MKYLIYLRESKKKTEHALCWFLLCRVSRFKRSKNEKPTGTSRIWQTIWHWQTTSVIARARLMQIRMWRTHSSLGRTHPLSLCRLKKLLVSFCWLRARINDVSLKKDKIGWRQIIHTIQAIRFKCLRRKFLSRAEEII